MKTAVFDSADSKTKLLPILATGLAFTYLISRIPAITVTETEPAAPKTTATQSLEPQPPQDFSSIGDFHLFGRPKNAASPTFAGLASESTLPLKLKGVLYLPDKQAYAIIEASGQSQKTYRINDALPGGAMLQAIESSRVIIRAGNRQESLVLTQTKLEQPESQSAAEQQAAQPADEIVVQPPESLSTY